MVAVPRPAGPQAPELLSPLKHVGMWLLLGVVIVMFGIGLAGMVVLTDTEVKYEITRSEFGEFYRWLISKNPFFSAFFVNFGVLGIAYCIKKLRDHKKASQTKKEAPAAAAAATAAGGSKPAESKKKK